MALKDPIARKAYNKAYHLKHREEQNAANRRRYHEMSPEQVETERIRKRLLQRRRRVKIRERRKLDPEFDAECRRKRREASKKAWARMSPEEKLEHGRKARASEARKCAADPEYQSRVMRLKKANNKRWRNAHHERLKEYRITRRAKFGDRVRAIERASLERRMKDPDKRKHIKDVRKRGRMRLDAARARQNARTTTGENAVNVAKSFFKNDLQLHTSMLASAGIVSI